MDTHNSKHYKNKKKVLIPEKSNGGAEMYVLPPDILQKLGINLGTVNSDYQLPSDIASKSDSFDQEQFKNAQDIFSNNSDKTISETASLLKESMLITGSPTLTPPVSRIGENNEISNESVELNNSSKIALNGVSYTGNSELNGKAHPNYIETLPNSDVKNNEHLDDSSSKMHVICDENQIRSVDSDVIIKQFSAGGHSLEEDEDENQNYYDIKDENKSFLKDKIRNMVINKYAPIKESDGKNHNVITSTKNCNESSNEIEDGFDDTLNIPNPNSLQISCPSTTPKISIISEEIVDTLKLREFKKRHTQNVADLTRVTIKTVITAKKTDDIIITQGDTLLEKEICSNESDELDSVRDTPSSASLPNEINDYSHDECNAVDNEYFSFVNNLMNKGNLNDARMSSGIRTTLLDVQLNTLKENDHTPAHSDVEFRVKENVVETELNEAIKNDNKNELSVIKMNELSHGEVNLYKSTQNEPIIVHDKEIANIEEHMTVVKSKLSVQGVEKPGGEHNEKSIENIRKIIKTYQRCKTPTKLVKHNPTTECADGVSLSHQVCPKEIDAVASFEEHKHEEFCKCKDFGMLNFYDDGEYEHIHFWKKANSNINPELIFSIYDEEYCKTLTDVDDLSYMNIKNKEESNENFCWSEYICEESEECHKENSKVLKATDNDFLGCPNSNDKTRTNNDTGVLKRKSKNSMTVILGDDSKTTENVKELSIVKLNTKSPEKIRPEEINKVLEVPVPVKRGRGRPRKHFKPILADGACGSTSNGEANGITRNLQGITNNDQLESVSVQHSDSVLGIPSNTQPKDHNDIIEEMSPCSGKRLRKTIINTKHSQGNSLRASGRTARNRSLLSTSDCSESNNSKEDTPNIEYYDVQCGVCDQVMKSSVWIDHIAKEHDYIAWKDGSKPIDVNDELEVKNHLQNILKDVKALVCYTCGIKRKYITSYFKHRKICGLNGVSVTLDNSEVVENDDLNTSVEVSKMNVSIKNSRISVRCGVCNEDLKGTDWIRHIQRQHNYLAWIDGETPLEVNDAAEVQKYLMSLAKKLGGLICYKCGLIRKYANIYLQHVKTCEAEGYATVDNDVCLIPTGDKLRCGVCSEEVMAKEWRQHAMSKHYNVAWIVGAPPIDVKNFYVVESYLKEYKNKYNKLVCRICGDSKISFCGFYAHVIQCGKTEEEIDKYKEYCDICNKTYLCMYKSQHLTMHREKEYARERRLKLAELREQTEQEQDTDTPGRRRAAEKARNVIAKYKDEIKENSQKGEVDFSTGYSSDSDVSVKLEQYTDDESDDTDDNCDISEEEEMEKKRKRIFESNAPTITRVPFPVNSVRTYIQESFEDYCKNHLTREKLFSEWSDCEYEKLGIEQIDKYMPTLNESCKVKVAQEDWSTYKRFQVKKINDCITMFVGASIQCVSWVPVHLDDMNAITGNFLAVACHSGTDSPRYNCDEAPEHENLLQIWDFGDFQTSMPKLALGLAHDYGTIWSMDWCPSGARDFIKEENGGHTKMRLGLLSIACSNGSAYIFSIPYPSAITVDDEPFYKLKPVAELRLASIVDHERKYQATTLRWSVQKGHNIVMVGYSHGTVAYYDLSNESPLLVGDENGVTVIHPFYDERTHTSCVTGVDSYAGGAASWRGGAACSASASGARVLTGPPARASALLSALACAGAFFLPHWPSAVLTSVNSKVNQTVNEVEWQSVSGGRSGRRVGGVRARAACARCGALAAACPPLLSVLHAHPAQHRQHAPAPPAPPAPTTRDHHDITKHVAAVLQMTSLAQKRKQTTDELAMKLEPLTYDDAVLKYGIEFQLVPKKSKAHQQKALSIPMLHYPERFPLAEVTSMSFCPSAACHNKLAVGTHAGILFIVSV